MCAAKITSLPRRDPATLLVLEGDVLIRCLICDELRARGFKVFEASSPGEARAILASMRVDLAVLDIDGSDGRGADLARWARTHHPRLRVILASARPEAAAPAAGESLPVLRKPYLAAQVAGVVERFFLAPDAQES